MRLILAFSVLVGSLGTSPTTAQSSAGTLKQRLEAIDSKTPSVADCVSQLEKAATSNGPDLIFAGWVCEKAGKFEESSYLLIAGQLRATTDLLLLPPATQADDQGLMALYGMLYFGGGVSGIKDEVLRDPESRKRFMKSFEEWTPVYEPSYDPGWNARKRPDAAKYRATIVEGKAGLRQYMDRTVRLVSDDQYYEAHRQQMQLLERNRNGIKPGTPEGKLFDELKTRKRERAIALGIEVGPSTQDIIEATESKATVAEMRENFPPYSPEKSEVVVTNSGGPIVERCLDLAERSAVSQGGKLVRVLVTSSTKWGTIWRADIAGGDQSSTRFTCTETTSSSSPMEIGDAEIPPLQDTAGRSK